MIRFKAREKKTTKIFPFLSEQIFVSELMVGTLYCMYAFETKMYIAISLHAHTALRMYTHYSHCSLLYELNTLININKKL